MLEFIFELIDENLWMFDGEVFDFVVSIGSDESSVDKFLKRVVTSNSLDAGFFGNETDVGTSEFEKGEIDFCFFFFETEIEEVGEEHMICCRCFSTLYLAK